MVNPHRIKEIRKTIFYLDDYHKYWLRDGTKNPLVNRITKLILDLKCPNCANHTKAVQFFGRRLIDFLDREGLVDHKERLLAVVVPSHRAGQISEGLIGVIRHTMAAYDIVYPRNALMRTKTIQKDPSALELVQEQGAIPIYSREDYPSVIQRLKVGRDMLLKEVSPAAT